MPYTMARSRGYRRIIVVDISSLGVIRRPHIQGGTTVYIKNSIPMGGIFDFDQKFLHQFMKLGYLYTIRTFDRPKGYRYFLFENARLETRFSRYLESAEANELVAMPKGADESGSGSSPSINLRRIFPRIISEPPYYLQTDGLPIAGAIRICSHNAPWGNLPNPSIRDVVSEQ